MNHVIRVGTLFSFVACSMLVFSGCATIFNGSSEAVSFGSEPPGAKVFINGMYMGETPIQFELKCKKDYVVEFKKEGYTGRSVMLNSSVGAGWVILDLLWLWCILPLAIDAATGAWFGFDHDYLAVALDPQK